MAKGRERSLYRDSMHESCAAPVWQVIAFYLLVLAFLAVTVALPIWGVIA